MLYPYMPETSRIIRKQLNAPDEICVLSPRYNTNLITNILFKIRNLFLQQTSSNESVTVWP